MRDARPLTPARPLALCGHAGKQSPQAARLVADRALLDVRR